MPAPSQNLQALRGVACLMVVLFHVWCLETEFGRQTPVLKETRWFGFAGVDLFFVLSGFLITATNLRHFGRAGAVPSFLFRRAWRIYPAYWVWCAVSVPVLLYLGGSGVLGPGAGGAWPRWVLLLPSEHENGILGAAWTLRYEMMFYLAFGVLLFAPPRVAALVLGVWAGFVVCAIGRPEPASPLGKQLVNPFVLEFLGGAAVAWLAAVREVRRWWRPALVLGVAWAAAGVAAVVAANPGVWYGDALGGRRALVYGPAAVLIVYAAAASEGRWRVPAWLRRTGDASYSLYLTHVLVLVVAKFVGCLVPHTRTGHTLWVVGSFAAVLAVGFAYHRWVERPLLNLGNRKTPVVPQPAPAPALAA